MILDYAHSPDSLENILKAVRQTSKGRMIALFGCGGNRDAAKRPIMGEIAGELADYCILYLNERMIFATHGHVFNEKNLPQLKKGDILLHGHTHVPVCKETEDYIYLNPGSVSIPKENSWHGYMILEDGTFVWKDLEGNVQKEFCPQL